MLTNLTCAEFIENLASNSPAPGGGSVSAMAGSLGGALATMVARLTLGKEQFKEGENDMREVLVTVRELQKKLLAMVDEDTQAFNKVMLAYKMSKDTAEQQGNRKEAIQHAMRHAACMPLEAAEHSLEVLKLCRFMVEKGNPNALSDGGVGALMAAAGVQGSLFNVEINLSSIKDEKFVTATRCRVREIELETDILREEIIVNVKRKLCK